MSSNNTGEEQPPTTGAADSDATAIGPADDETVIVPPPTGAPHELAWSHDEDDDAGVSWGAAAERAGIIFITAVAVALVLGLVTWLGLYIYGKKSKPMPVPDAAKPVATIPAAAPVPPPSTVTVTPAPPPTVTVEAAPPPPRQDEGAAPPPASGSTDIFTICPDGHEGVVGGHTTCAFAENVRRNFYATGMSDNFTAFSPVTGDAYEMTCVGRYPAYFDDGSTMISTRCYGGDNAEVVIW
ncbi:hypothetical protein [Mycobacterium sp. Lab-001]|uniref:hypothetical protein n=1 Tax=Mycobacterium sp. Lab-001 TaxID=3410136 RepID=UPI003D177139